ncbi:WPP domain-interacting tail-anchored protein 1 [Vigna radiata var. radiata]|uniref:WPP domain-interacting tail-anchored protein 1 n=1 Tax=Vigna radiata var. radiata TaxID=3916 RepID=A0A1S3VVV8_VIGRR|nr:WPP domain-interacting tail-anchored protein 1 [Vigna radiata var. radiata]
MSTESAKNDASVVLEDVVVSLTSGSVMGDLGDVCSRMLTRLDLGVGGFSEKVSNLTYFVMYVEIMECKIEASVLEKEKDYIGCLEKGLQFDLLSVLLNSEATELREVFNTLQGWIGEAREWVLSYTHLGEAFVAMQDKLVDYEQQLNQSEEELNDIEIKSADFQRTLATFKKAEIGEIIGEDDKSLNGKTEIKLQTVEQQRSILRMLEKSWAKELDLEKDLLDSREVEETLKQRMFFTEQKLVNMEEEAIYIWERWLEADNASEVLLGISKGLLGRLHISQFSLKGLSHRESELRVNLKDAEDKLTLANSKVFSLSDKVSSLEKQLKESDVLLLDAKAASDEYQKQYNLVCSEARDMRNIIVELKEAVFNAESRANGAETKYNILTETNLKLNEELDLLKGTSARGDLLERQLKASTVRLQNAVASAKASQEKQSKLYSTIREKENVIKDLKSKVLKAETRADSAEDNCIILSESNAELNEELSFLRNRLESVEESLHREEEMKMETAKGIGKQAKVFKKLITQLAVERERLKQQISSLASENKILVVKLKQKS